MMDSFEALRTISRHRGNAIVVATMTSHFEWPQVSTCPDLDLVDSGAMGKDSSVGLGLALAMPDKKVIVLDGDGSLLMNLGSLVTIANMAPKNFIHFLFENRVYRTTGGQPIPALGKLSFAGLAAGAGYPNVHVFEDLKSLEEGIGDVMKSNGPTFVCVKVAPGTKKPSYPIVRTADIVPGFRAALRKG